MMFLTIPATRIFSTDVRFFAKGCRIIWQWNDINLPTQQLPEIVHLLRRDDEPGKALLFPVLMSDIIAHHTNGEVPCILKVSDNDLPVLEFVEVVLHLHDLPRPLELLLSRWRSGDQIDKNARFLASHVVGSGPGIHTDLVVRKL